MSEGWLVGWDAIAKHIGYSVRWTKEFHYVYHMPVLRFWGRVKADPEEIDAWIRKSNKLFTDTARIKHGPFRINSRRK